MATRIQLNVTHYMVLDGQPQLVETGTIIDVPDANIFPLAAATVLPQAAGPLLNNGNTTVRKPDKGGKR